MLEQAFDFLVTWNHFLSTVFAATENFGLCTMICVKKGDAVGFTNRQAGFHGHLFAPCVANLVALPALYSDAQTHT